MEKITYEQLYLNEESHWWFIGTRNIIFDFIAQNIKNKQNIKILDIGCGTGIVLKKLEKIGACYGIDISEEAILFCKKRKLKNVYKANAENLPFINESFDLITVLDVLEHIKNPQNVLNEINRILKNDGIAIITVPAFKFLWSSHDKMLHHITRYDKSELFKVLKTCNFNISRISYYNFFLFPIIAGIRISKKLFKIDSKTTDVKKTGKIFNDILISILNFESKILKKFNLPFGVSIIAIIKKTNK
ncbi:MAG: class I SAM-dependent methyltransferase [Mesotoga sp.]|nr:class I SAM-dependent methyltransferase [Mesotoga sp.]